MNSETKCEKTVTMIQNAPLKEKCNSFTLSFDNLIYLIKL